MTEAVAVAPARMRGAGKLFDALSAAMAQQWPDGVAVLVSACDTWCTEQDASWRDEARQLGVRWLPVRTEVSHVVIGPMEEPGRPGCGVCADLRRRRVREDRIEWAAVRKRHAERLATRPPARLDDLVAYVVAAVVSEELASLVAGEAPRTRNALLRLNLADLTITGHRFLPEPHCEVCGSLPDDSPELARIELRPHPAARPGAYRVRDLAGELDRLSAMYVDDQTGLIHSLNGWSDGGLVMTSAPLGFRGGLGNAGFGRAPSFAASRLTALLESLERYSSSPGGKRTAVVGSFEQLRGDALDPRQLGLYPPERYELPGFAFRPFSPDQPYRWVWGWSFAQSRPLLVPEACAYYGVSGPDASHRFVYECSNGCALGNCLAEACLYGLLEVAERDAFLLTWYARLPAPEIDLASLRGHRVRLLAEAIRAETGYQIRLFDITTEQRIPCVWAVAVNPAADGGPALASAGGSHPDPYRAVGNALAELGPNLASLRRQYAEEGAPERARRMVVDADEVREMDDHALLHADPDGASRLEFLLATSPSRAAAEIGGDPGGFASDDLAENLREAVSRYTDHGLDVIVVDQSTPEQRVGGFDSVKVLIPGTLPMTFGHRFRRVDGLPRLHTVPQLLGYRNRPLRPDEVNADPHPFP